MVAPDHDDCRLAEPQLVQRREYPARLAVDVAHTGQVGPADVDLIGRGQRVGLGVGRFILVELSAWVPIRRVDLAGLRRRRDVHGCHRLPVGLGGHKRKVRLEEAQAHEERSVLVLQLAQLLDRPASHQPVGQVFVVFGDELHQVLVPLPVLSVTSALVGEEGTPAAPPGTVGRGQLVPGAGQLGATVAFAVVGVHLAVGSVRDLADADGVVAATSKQLGQGLGTVELPGIQLGRSGVHGRI